MGKQNFKGYICRPFCKFYHDGHKEGLSCKGAQVIEYLIQHQKIEINNLKIDEVNYDEMSYYDTFLEETVCNHCLFQVNDCDFQSKKNIGNAKPCGGYILLWLLKQKGKINLRELFEEIHLKRNLLTDGYQGNNV